MPHLTRATGEVAIDTPRPRRAELLCARVDPARVYAWLGGISLFMLVILVPPFQVPDEPQHFFRSYQLSRLQLWAPVQNGVAGADLPASMSELVLDFIGADAINERVLPTRRLIETLAELKRPLDPTRTAFVKFSNIAFYAPPPYVPSAAAIAAGRGLGMGPLGLLYMGRFANALVALLLTCIALRLFRAGRKFALLIALLPMTQFLTASLSADAMTIASAFLFTSILSRFLADRRWPAGRMLAAFVSGVAMCAAKVVYGPVLLAGVGSLFVRDWRARPEVRAAVLRQVGAAGVTMVVALVLWSASNVGDVTQNPPDTDFTGQLTFVLHNPGAFILIALRSLAFNAKLLIVSTLGFLGWLTLRLPDWVYIALGAAFLLCAYIESREAPLPVSLVGWLLLVAGTAVMLLELALYLTWTPFGSDLVGGTQGRYFIPLLPLLGFAAASLLARYRPVAYPNQAYACLVAILGAATIAMHVTIIKHYGLF